MKVSRYLRRSFLTFAIDIAKCCLSHVAELDSASTCAVHHDITMKRMEIGRCDDFSELFHIVRLNVNDI